MKLHNFPYVLGMSALALFSFVADGAEVNAWAFKDLRAWAREKDAVKLVKLSDGAFEVRHTGGADWCVNGCPQIAVKHGDVFELSCETEPLADMPDSRTVCMSVILRDAKGVEVSWSYGEGHAKPGQPIQTTFMVPRDVATVQPRVLGHGVTAARVRNVRVTRTGNALPKSGLIESCAFANGLLRGRVCGAGFEVEDVRTGRTWKPAGGSRWTVEELDRRQEADGSVRATFINPETMKSWKAIYRVEKDRPEVVVTLEGEGTMTSPFAYPAAFASRKGDRLIVPLNEGISYPADDPDGVPGRLIAYGGHGICMAFFGVQDDATGAGWMAILETPDDVAMVARRDAETQLWTLGPSWEDQKRQFGYARRIRYVFLDKGGYVAMCKRYRAHAKAIGKFKSFSEKVKERPLVDRLLGAPNVWCVLVGRYDIYQDIYHPDQLKKLGWKSGCNTEAWPKDIIWNSANSNDWRHAWPVKAKDGTWTYCAMMCDSVADVLEPGPPDDALGQPPLEDGASAHPRRRVPPRRRQRDGARRERAVLRLLRGHALARAVPRAGLRTQHLADLDERAAPRGEVPGGRELPPAALGARLPRVRVRPLVLGRLQQQAAGHLVEARPLQRPLRHDGQGMYIFNNRQWKEDKEKFVRSYRITSPVARATGYSEMLDHRILSPDRTVQQSRFADGTVVTVNFGTAPYTLPDGYQLPAAGYRVLLGSTAK